MKRKTPAPLKIPQMPFDDALRTLLRAPAQPKMRKKSRRALSKRTK
jgi:hypothetical protein